MQLEDNRISSIKKTNYLLTWRKRRIKHNIIIKPNPFIIFFFVWSKYKIMIQNNNTWNLYFSLIIKRKKEFTFLITFGLRNYWFIIFIFVFLCQTLSKKPSSSLKVTYISNWIHIRVYMFMWLFKKFYKLLSRCNFHFYIIM